MDRTTCNLHIALFAAIATLGCASASTPTPMPETAWDEPPAAADERDVTLKPAAGPALAPIYFDTDVAALGAEARDALAAHARAILAHPEWGVIALEGHCDERGSEEYNLALGERRAAATKRYLMDLGVPGSRLSTVTFGEARPAVAGHDEKAWRHNRRSELRSESLQSAKR